MPPAAKRKRSFAPDRRFELELALRVRPYAALAVDTEPAR
jgi:hypothetical protein